MDMEAGECRGPSWIHLEDVGRHWVLQVRDSGGEVHIVTVPPPRDEAGREDLIWLAISLLQPVGPADALIEASRNAATTMPPLPEPVAEPAPTPRSAGTEPPPPTPLPPATDGSNPSTSSQADPPPPPLPNLDAPEPLAPALTPWGRADMGAIARAGIHASLQAGLAGGLELRSGFRLGASLQVRPGSTFTTGEHVVLLRSWDLGQSLDSPRVAARAPRARWGPASVGRAGRADTSTRLSPLQTCYSGSWTHPRR